MRVWQLDCPRCTQFLKGDALWSGNAAKIPLTPDEERVIDQMKEEGARVRAQQEAVEAYSHSEKARTELETQRAEERHEAERSMLELRLAQMQAEMSRLYGMLDPGLASTGSDGAQVPSHGSEETPEAPSLPVSVHTASSAAKARTVTQVAAKAACAKCGGPLRKSGSRGPTPRGTCLDCRAKAQAQAKAKAKDKAAA